MTLLLAFVPASHDFIADTITYFWNISAIIFALILFAARTIVFYFLKAREAFSFMASHLAFMISTIQRSSASLVALFRTLSTTTLIAADLFAKMASACFSMFWVLIASKRKSTLSFVAFSLVVLFFTSAINRDELFARWALTDLTIFFTKVRTCLIFLLAHLHTLFGSHWIQATLSLAIKRFRKKGLSTETIEVGVGS